MRPAVIWTSYQTEAGQIVMRAVFTARWETGAVAGRDWGGGREETAAVGGLVAVRGHSPPLGTNSRAAAAACSLSQKPAVFGAVMDHCFLRKRPPVV